MYKATLLKQDTLGDWEIEVNTKAAQRALNELAGKGMSWKAYKKITEAILELDKLVGSYQQGYIVRR